MGTTIPQIQSDNFSNTTDTAYYLSNATNASSLSTYFANLVAISNIVANAYLNVSNTSPFPANGIYVSWNAPASVVNLTSYTVKTYANGVLTQTDNVNSPTTSHLLTSVVENVYQYPIQKSQEKYL